MTPSARHSICYLVAAGLLAGCVTKVYRPGAPDSPLNRIKLGESYDDMVKMLGPPSESFSQDRSNKVAAAAVIPIFGLVDIASNHNPSSVQSYHYDHIGTVTIDNDDRIIRVEADEWRSPHADIDTERALPAPTPKASGSPQS
jgi:hypothetical protein